MENILVICRQNVGRSQMGEGFLRELTADDPDVSVSSDGLDIVGMKEKYDNRPHPQVIAVMQEVGIDISQQTIKEVNLGILLQATLIAVLSDEIELPDYFRDFLEKILIIPIEDPAPGMTSNEIPDLEFQKLRYTRDQIRQAMTQLVIK